MKRFIFSICALVLTASCMASANAAVTEKDALVLARIVKFLENAPQGLVEVAVANGGANTQADVDTLVSLISKTKTLGGITLKARSVNYDALASTNTKIVFIPEGITDAQLEIIFAAAKARKLVTISTSTDCLIKQKCAIGISSYPAVDIKISVAAAAATDVSFGSTFRMMIKEVR